MTPIRVDKVVHVDRIDAKIREEIEKADILIAPYEVTTMDRRVIMLPLLFLILE